MNEWCDILQEKIGDIEQEMRTHMQKLDREVFIEIDQRLNTLQQYLSKVPYHK